MDTLNDDPNQSFFTSRLNTCNCTSELRPQRFKRSLYDQKYHHGNDLFDNDLFDIDAPSHTKNTEAALYPAFGTCSTRWIKGVAIIALFIFSMWRPTTIFAAEVTLQWDPVDDGTTVDYRVYLRTGEDAYAAEPVWSGETSTCTINNLSASGTHCFVVRVLNTDGVESTNSNEVCTQAVEQTDSDGDGMPDDWETAMGLDPNADDSQDDPDGDSISNIDEYENSSDPFVPAQNAPPIMPTGQWPTEGEIIDTLVPELGTDEFADTDEQSNHSRTQWRIVRTFDNLCVFDGRSKTFLTKFKIPNFILESETEYAWQVRFFDEYGAASEWSAEKTFETPMDMSDIDGDGIPDAQAVDQSLDVNGDGIVDTMQPDTIKCVVGNNDGVLGISIDEPQANNLISAMSNGDPQNYVLALNQPVDMPYGLFEYRIEVTEPGSSITVNVFLPETADEASQWYRLSIDNDWIDYSDYAQFSSDRKTITLELKDGGYGDIDGIENGVIVDRSGLMLTPQSSGGNGSASSFGWEGSGACFIGTAKKSEEVEQFYLWLAVAGIAMILLGKIAAIWHEKFPRGKKAQ